VSRPPGNNPFELFSVREPGRPKPTPRNTADPHRAEVQKRIEMIREQKELDADNAEVWE